jgi:hypothetical protein
MVAKPARKSVAIVVPPNAQRTLAAECRAQS